MDAQTAVEILKLEIKSKRQKAECELDLPRNAPKHRRDLAERRAKFLRDEADAVEMAMRALEAVQR